SRSKSHRDSPANPPTHLPLSTNQPTDSISSNNQPSESKPSVEGNIEDRLANYGYIATANIGKEAPSASHQHTHHRMGRGEERYFNTPDGRVLAQPIDPSTEHRRTFPSKNTGSGVKKRVEGPPGKRRRSDKYCIGGSSSEDEGNNYPIMGFVPMKKERSPSRSPMPDGTEREATPPPPHSRLFVPPPFATSVAPLFPLPSSSSSLLPAHIPSLLSLHFPTAPSILGKTKVHHDRPPPPKVDEIIAAMKDDQYILRNTIKKKVSDEVITISDDEEEKKRIAEEKNQPKSPNKRRIEFAVGTPGYSLEKSMASTTGEVAHEEEEGQDAVPTPHDDDLPDEREEEAAVEEEERQVNISTSITRHSNENINHLGEPRVRNAVRNSVADVRHESYDRTNMCSFSSLFNRFISTRSEMNNQTLPNRPTLLHPGVQGSKLVIDLWSGETVVEGQDGRETGFTFLSDLTFTQRCDTSFRVCFGGESRLPPAVYYDTQSRTSGEEPDFGGANAIIDAVERDWQRSKRFHEWEREGNAINHDVPCTSDSSEWREERKKKRREQKEKSGEWEDREWEGEEKEKKREEQRKEESDRELFDLLEKHMKKKGREEEQSNGLRNMAAALLKKADEMEAEEARRAKMEQRKNERRAFYEKREKRRRAEDEGEKKNIEEEQRKVEEHLGKEEEQRANEKRVEVKHGSELRPEPFVRSPEWPKTTFEQNCRTIICVRKTKDQNGKEGGLTERTLKLYFERHAELDEIRMKTTQLRQIAFIRLKKRAEVSPLLQMTHFVDGMELALTTYLRKPKVPS
ncbi:hypothetical protein PMAYCL1PPCAC_28869, partial [Pristionchus mayeri]